MSRHIKTIVFSLILGAIPVLILVGSEGILRITGYGRTYRLTDNAEVNGIQYHRVVRNYPDKYFRTKQGAPEFRDRDFPAVKTDGTVRIVALGGSSMFGFPYSYSINTPQMLEFMLNMRYPDHRWEVIDLATSAVNSYTVADIVKQLGAYDPDLLLIYAGHNEFYGAFGSGSRESIPGGHTLVKLDLALKNIRIYQLMSSLVSGRKSVPPPGSGATLMSRIVDDRMIPYQSEKYYRTLDNFRSNLEEIADRAGKAGWPVVIGSLTSNLKDQSPFVSQFNDADFNPDDAAAKIDAFIVTSDSSGFRDYLDTLAASEGRSAFFHFSMGRYFMFIGEPRKAEPHFELARDLDALRFRASGDLNRLIRDEAARKGWIFCDIDSVFHAESVSGVPGNDLFLEHLHPNARGTFLMARTFAGGIMEAQPNAAPADSGLLWSDYTDFLTMYPVTDFELRYGEISIEKLKMSWPFADGSESYRFIYRDALDSLVIPYATGRSNWGQAQNRAAEMYRRTGNKVGERKILQNIYLANPVNSAVLTKLAGTYEEAGEFKKGISWLAVAKNMSPDPSPYILSGILAYNGKDLPTAESEFAGALQRYSQMPDGEAEAPADLLFNYLSVIAMQGRYREASERLKPILPRFAEDRRFSELDKKLSAVLKK